jgi:hypothetical protein
MSRTTVIRILTLYGPAALTLLPWALQRPPRRRMVSAFLASAWNLPALLFVNTLAPRMGWWTFGHTHVELAGVPLDVLLGWAILWGAMPVMLMHRIWLPMCVALLVAIDFDLMPLAQPVVVLGDTWLVGEAVAVLVALIPSQLLARLTEHDRGLEWRGVLQGLAFTALMLWLLPTTILAATSGTWDAFLDNSLRYGGLPLQLALIPGLVGVSALQEFVMRGRGTPLPFDAPRKLVVSGPYAYVANPMQLSLTLVLVAWGALMASPSVAFAGVIAVFYSVGIAQSDEYSDLSERFGSSWRVYRRHVNSWLPRWRPYHPTDDSVADAQPARLYVAASCVECSEVGRWFLARAPRGLEIVPAELHPTRTLSRITYDPCDGGRDESGVAAVARALEHLHLGWAMVGWFMRLPLLVSALQLLSDASGGAARRNHRGLVGARIARPGRA